MSDFPVVGFLWLTAIMSLCVAMVLWLETCPRNMTWCQLGERIKRFWSRSQSNKEWNAAPRQVHQNEPEE